MSTAKVTAITTAVFIFMTGLLALFTYRRPEPLIHREYTHFRCAIEFGHYDDTTAGLITGYNYYLLEKYATDRSATVDIQLSDSLALERLKVDSTDLVIIPYLEPEFHPDSVLVSSPIDSLSLWVVRNEDTALLSDINDWLEDWHRSPQHDTVRRVFMTSYYNPYRRRSVMRYLSPYDDYFKEAADSIGWDWRLIAAMAWKESHFRIDARSRRGAGGLMQIMPHTATTMGADNVLDPRQSIMGAAYYLKRLTRYFPDAADAGERIKFTLAAYNGGEGYIKNCITYAASKDADISVWDSVAVFIPMIRDEEDAVLDSLGITRIKGDEVLNYVESVTGLWNEFRRISGTP